MLQVHVVADGRVAEVEILDSSDHLILDVEDLDTCLSLGDTVTFIPNYAATLQLFTSSYVDKVYVPARSAASI